MPTYEYRCPEGHEFEKFYRTISGAQTTVVCPTCGKPAERLLSGGAGLMFKGSGFYLTDYGRNAHSRGASRPAAKPEGSATPEAKSESKAEKPASGDAAPAAAPAPAKKPSAE